MSFNTRRVGFIALTALLLVGVMEVGLSLLSGVSPAVERLLDSPWETRLPPHAVPDARLGRRPNPDYPGHDAKGFRNPSVPAAADVVTLGDSQTYGTGVDADAAWPRQLEDLTSQSVYNMAYGSYGPAHSLLMWDEAMALQPEVVIEAFYSGNDLYDAFELVYGRGQLPELKSDDPALAAAIAAAEGAEPIDARVARMMDMVPKALGEDLDAPLGTAALSPRRFMSRHSKLYGLVRRTQYALSRPPVKASEPAPRDWESAKLFASQRPSYCQVFDQGPFRTLFTSEYRLAALDLDDPRIAEGHGIALRALQRMQALSAERGVRFVVLLVPTKEYVFGELWDDPAPSFVALMENEARLWATTRAFLDAQGIEYVDALPALRSQLAEQVQPYQVDYDGHPNEHGHRAVAAVVAETLF